MASSEGSLESGTGGWPVALRALKHRNFRLFFIGQLISLVGTWMQSTAQQWLVYRLSGSGALLGLIGFAGQIPILLVGPHWRQRCRRLRSSTRGHRNPDRLDVACVCPGMAEFEL